MSEETLILHIQNVSPIEVLDLTSSLESLASDYKRHLAINEAAAAAEEVKLFIKEVRPGSTVVEMVAEHAETLKGIVGYGVTLLGFMVAIKKSMKYLKGDPDAKKPENLDKTHLQNIGNIVNHTAKDRGATITLSATQNGKIAETVVINYTESNVIQNTVRREIENLKEVSAHNFTSSVLTFFQAKNDPSSCTGDKAIIESISRSPVRTIIPNESMKARMLGVYENPFKKAYIVDGRVETVNGRPVLYVILGVRSETIDIPQQQILRLESDENFSG